MTKTLSRKKLTTLSQAVHQAAWDGASLFGEDHRFKQGYANQQGGMFVKHGYYDSTLEFVPIAEVVKGARLRNKHTLPEVSAQSACRLLRQSFAGHKYWSCVDRNVKTRDFIEPIAKVLTEHGEHFDVFAGVYENKLTGTNVFGMFILLKDVEGEDRLAMEITIDDADLHPPGDIRTIFR